MTEVYQSLLGLKYNEPKTELAIKLISLDELVKVLE